MSAHPDTPTDYTQAALNTVRGAARTRNRSYLRLTQAILQAKSYGLSHAEIARAAGMSRQRVQQIVKGAERTCGFCGCDRPARKGWTMCNRHYSAGKSASQIVKGAENGTGSN